MSNPELPAWSKGNQTIAEHLKDILMDEEALDELTGYQEKSIETVIGLLDGIGSDRLEEICAAERDGRLVVLPCKVGDTVYVLPNYTAYWDDIEETKITGVSQFPTKSGVSNQIVTGIGLCYEWERDFGVRLFLTRALAEEALAQDGGHDE